MAPLAARTAKPFTGRHMALVMIGFFGVVVSVNMLLANLVVATFSGKLVENSYVASQGFNRLLGAAAADKALGWRMALGRGKPGTVRVCWPQFPVKACVRAPAIQSDAQTPRDKLGHHFMHFASHRGVLHHRLRHEADGEIFCPPLVPLLVLKTSSKCCTQCF